MYDPREEIPLHSRVRDREPAVRRSERVLTVEDLEARLAEEAELPELAVESAAVEVTPSAPADPDAALRHARIGLVAAAALVLLLVWIMQRKKGA